MAADNVVAQAQSIFINFKIKVLLRSSGVGGKGSGFDPNMKGYLSTFPSRKAEIEMCLENSTNIV